MVREEIRGLAKLLQDIPRWLELRSGLLDGTCEVIGSGDLDELSYVAVDLDDPFAFVVGRPLPEVIRKAVGRMGRAGDVLCQVESEELVRRALPDWEATPAMIYRLRTDELLPTVRDGTVRLLGAADVASLKGLPQDLSRELQVPLRRGRPIAATFVDGTAVSFCYAGSSTETLWDISIDTLEPYRRQGYAAQCVTFLVRLMRERGKQPVWGALETNEASMGLAKSLGFEPVDRLIVFEAEEA